MSSLCTSGKKEDERLAEGLMAPQKKPLIQPAARWLLRQRPFEPELVDSLRHNADELFIRSGLALREADDDKRAGQSQSLITLPGLKPPEIIPRVFLDPVIIRV